jgi:hypothetical protein
VNVCFDFKVEKSKFVGSHWYVELTESLGVVKINLHLLTNKHAKIEVFSNCEDFHALINLKQLCIDLVRHFYFAKLPMSVANISSGPVSAK